MKPIYRIWDKQEKKYLSDEFHKLPLAALTIEGRLIFVLIVDDEIKLVEADDFYPDRYLIERCTGLKDMNDVWIYEGDIVERYYSIKLFGVGIVTADYPNFHLQYTNGEIEKAWNNERMKVIGNIHENAELLKEIDNES